ncbi:ABC transporter permease [Timonella sp. A28]|uniref:ABC transporter permease n=1 Tax=Timonella sp. A28 TaxID=3442640 RepID=UPI003EC0FD35
MKATLVSEYRKFVSTRMWWILLIIMVVYMGATAAGMAFMFTVDAGDTGQDAMALDPATAPSIVYTTSVSFGYVFPALIGVLSFTGEFRHKTITPTLLAVPKRGRILWAKMCAAIPMGVFYGLGGTFGCVALGGLVLSVGGVDPQLGSADTWEIIGRSVLSTTIWLIVGVALGSIITNQVAAIVTLIVFTQFIEPIARIALPAAPGGDAIAQYLPGGAGDAIAGGSFYALSSSTELLPLWAAIAVLLGYAVLFAAIGRVTTLKRDIS